MKEYLIGSKNVDNFVFYDLSTIDSLEKALEKTKEYVIEREYETKESKFESKATGFIHTFEKKSKLLEEKIYLKNGLLKEDLKEYIPNKVKILRDSLSSYGINIKELPNLVFDYFDDLTDSLKEIISEDEMEGNVLYLAPIILSSGSKDVKEKEVYLDGNTINIDIDIICPEIGTDDIAIYTIFAFIPKAFIVDKEKYVFRCIEKNKL